jgi:EAL domain-containing protein (putative c-di-GMP-specific phosphodiesterase class I)
MQNLDAALATMRQLQDMGVKLAIDDFGNSYASLGELKNYPNVRLKLDQSFIGELADRQDRGALAQAVIRLGHELKFNVIAEGVEADTPLHFVRDNERREIQRYHDTPPVSADAIAAMLRVPRTVQATMQIDR